MLDVPTTFAHSHNSAVMLNGFAELKPILIFVGALSKINKADFFERSTYSGVGYVSCQSDSHHAVMACMFSMIQYAHPIFHGPACAPFDVACVLAEAHHKTSAIQSPEAVNKQNPKAVAV